MINGLTIDEINSIGNFIEAIEKLPKPFVIRMRYLDVCEPSMSVTLIEWEEPQTYGFVQQERGLAGSISYNAPQIGECVWTCENGHTLDRDMNASINVKRFAFYKITTTEGISGSNACGDETLVSSMKQEAHTIGYAVGG